MSDPSTNIVGTFTGSALDGAASDLSSDQEPPSTWLAFVAKLVLVALQGLTTILYRAVMFLFATFTAHPKVALLLTAMIAISIWYVRFRVLNKYSRLPPEPQRKEPKVDIFPETHEDGHKPGLAYLDEFLSVIKIFGYLERPVFHELTRSMQTRKLISGETWNLEEEKGFCSVVDGDIEIFVKSARDHHSGAPFPENADSSVDDNDDESLESGSQKYQLLTEVQNGGAMSSLFSVMSIFTEDVHLHRPEEDGSDGPSSTMRSHDNVSFPNSPSCEGRTGRPVSTALASIHHHGEPPPISLDTSSRPHRKQSSKSISTPSVHPDLIARAMVDTTIAIIPASAFRRLIKVYPKATAHIVHVILSRFQRVTLATAYNYLGLSGEVLRTEMDMINYTMCQLPNVMRGDALGRLKEKFKRELELLGPEEGHQGIALHNSGAHRHRRPTTSLRKEAMLHTLPKPRHNSAVAPTNAHSQERTVPDSMGLGDVASKTEVPRLRDGMPGLSASATWDLHEGLRKDGPSPIAQRAFNPYATQKHTRASMDPRDSLEEENSFRTCILECIFKAIGLGQTPPPKDVESKEPSPRLTPFDPSRAKTSNAFGDIGPLDATREVDADSVTSVGVAVNAALDPHLLATDMKDEVEIFFFRKGSVLVEQGERNPGLYYVVDGFLDICVPSREADKDIIHPPHRRSGPSDGQAESHFGAAPADQSHAQDNRKKAGGARKSVGFIKPGGLAGYIGTVSSYRSFFDIVAKTDVYVGFLPRSSLERIVEKYPIVLFTMAKRLTSMLPRLISHLDFALEWVQVNAGHVLFDDGDESDAIYLVLNGRLRLVDDGKGGGVNVRGEYGQGDSVGELEVLTESAMSGTLLAIRDTELVKFPRSLFNSLAQEHPNITIKISKIIASRMRALVGGAPNLSGSMGSGGKGSSILNIRTVAILPVSSGVPVVDFAAQLMAALAQVGPPNGATHLNQAAILKHLGKHAFNKMGKLRLSQYLADLEEKYGLVVYVADTNFKSPWTQKCITQADCVLLVAVDEDSPQLMKEYDRFLLRMKSTARKVLVLLHRERYSRSGLTRSWLKNHAWINGGHYHIQMDFKPNSDPVHRPAKRFGATLMEGVQLIQAEIQKYTSRKVRSGQFYSPDAPAKGDFQRLARRLCGRSVGLVLGGGGARGISQIGIIRAMEEAGIPIDVVGGTSIGAFVGALYARHADVVPIFGLSKKFAGRMASIWRFALDLTYPSASYTTGHEFNRGIFKALGNVQIEDFWLEYYCNTTNISHSRQEFHTSGYAWRYVRASMSLAGLLPPLCDEGSMLLDGGYIDNLTVSHMKSQGVDTIFAVDVGALDDDTPQSFGDTLSGFWAFFNRWNPFSPHPNPPTLAGIQSRLAYVSSIDALERAKSMPGCFYMRPPIDDYGTLEFAKFDEICEVGYKYGQEFLQQLREEGKMPLMDESEAKSTPRRTMAPRRASI